MTQWHVAALAAAVTALAMPAQAGSGATQNDPVLPMISWGSVSGQITTPLRFHFPQPTSGLWFDPPLIDGFRIWLDSGSFTRVTAPDNISGLQLRVNGQLVDASFDANESYSFASGVSAFEIRSLRPAVDASSPSVATALPLQLFFSASQMVTWMTWEALPAAVPETDTYLMLIAGLGALGVATRARRR